MKALEIKNYTPARFGNMKACDQKYYSFSADWAQPQAKTVCTAALKAMTAKVNAVSAAFDADGWGSKPDTPELITALIGLLKTVKLGTDDQQNAFTCYQVERYVLRLWYRGTKEQRDAVKAKLEPKAPAKPKAEAKAPAKTQVKVKAKASTKKAAPKSAPQNENGAVVLHEVEVEDTQSAGIIDVLAQFLQDELSADQKRSLVTGLIAALK
jgi:hypothetical protein